MKVGIPQGLFYHYYYPLWKTFFEDLGVEVVKSGRTNRRILEQGIQAAVDETCLPIKVYYGHVGELCRQKVDYIFVPRLVSVEPKSYICPKFMGIPDMLRASFKELPPLIDLIIDVSRTYDFLDKDIIKVGKLFSGSKKAISQAYEHGVRELASCRKLCADGLNISEAIDRWEGDKVSVNRDYDLTLGVLGHGYSLYDSMISMNLINRLRDMGCRVQVPENMDNSEIEAQAALLPKRVFWTLGRKMMGCALHMQNNPAIDGIIYMACFGCGPDSIIGELIERKVKDKPFMMITIDEHTGEAGLVTRLEAFCDMLRRRRSRDAYNLSPYGQHAYSGQGVVAAAETGSGTSAAHQQTYI